MARLALHQPDEILDATRGLILHDGVRGATIDAIARRSGAPVGSLYHRFGSRDRLMAKLWVRAARRSQAIFVAAAQHPDAEQGAVNAALSIYEFVRRHPEDARLLVSFRREDLIRDARSPKLLRELKELNRPLQAALCALARRLFGKATAPAVEQTALAVIDIPMGALRRHLVAGSAIPPALPQLLETAVRAVLRHRRK
jgi:AcrR family transcriptional regulator